MFNFEMVCSEGIFQICDDIFSAKLTEKQAENCVRQFYKDLKNANACVYDSKDISFNTCIFWCNEEEKENILFNIALLEDIIFDMSDKIFDVFCNIENTHCPSYWMTLSNCVVSLIDYRNSLFK